MYVTHNTTWLTRAVRPVWSKQIPSNRLRVITHIDNTMAHAQMS